MNIMYRWYIILKKHGSYERGPKGLLFSRNLIIFLTRNQYAILYVSWHVCLRGTHGFGWYYALREPRDLTQTIWGTICVHDSKSVCRRPLFVYASWHGHIFPFMGISSLYHQVVCPRRWRGSTLHSIDGLHQGCKTISWSWSMFLYTVEPTGA